MVLTKSYLRYVDAGNFGVVGSTRANVCLVENGQMRRETYYAVVPALENIYVWDLRTGERVQVLKGNKSEVTCLCHSLNSDNLAVGYADGSIKIWNLADGSALVTFSGHKSAVTSLQYDQSGVRLVSGSKDTDVIIWDVINECGMFRLKGHKGMVTGCHFLETANVLVTSSKDTFVKFWDLDSQHCFLTLVGHRSEVWGFAITKNETRLITGCADSELRIWEIKYKEESPESLSNKEKKRKSTQPASDVSEETEGCLSCTLLGSVMRTSTDRVVSLCADPTGQYIGCHGANSTLELFRIATEDEIKKRLSKRRKKILKKQRSQAEEDGDTPLVTCEVAVTVDDEFIKLPDLKGSFKIRSFDFHLSENDGLKILLLLQNNSIELYHMAENQEENNVFSIKTPGHRSDVRTLSFNSDGSCILSGSTESVKVWNRTTQKCIRTMSSGYCLSSFFVPGDRHVVVGTKAGKIQIFDISSGALLESVDAHEGAVWSLAIAPDKTLFVSGSGDKDVKFWEFDLIADENYSKTSKRLSICHVRTLKMTDDVLSVKFSPNQKFIAVALLDFTIKVFFSDTLKFFLSLYGHKLPVVSMDISSDCVLLVSGGADKNIKIWGLDFGDCRKSIFAHDDSVMAVQFVPNTHYFFSASKDKTIKYWDADKFLHVMTLEGHHSEIWCLALSPDGEFVVSGSHDKSLRLWERTDEPLFVEEERDLEREAAYEESVVTGTETIIPGEQDSEAVKAGKKTIETIKGAERIMEAIELYKEERLKDEEHEAHQMATDKTLPRRAIHPILAAFGNVSPVHYVLLVVKKIKSSELEESLLVLPFDYVIDILKLFLEWMKNDWETELTCRCLFYLLRIHHNQIIASPELLPVMDSIRSHTQTRVREMKDVVGFNLAGLRFLQQQLEDRDVMFFGETREKLAQVRKKKRTAVRKFK
ncbi:WD repeat-containing protein 3-like [Dendronephthya gigantea]|uniref:WD repeat-containing protein 3-like n=1 Tax=Dendronephthya gigantea TaxID=151771 RepID=UPI00106C39E3|nr:WD repeat-containing protein 3-like [Dendronephthya gigantea]